MFQVFTIVTKDPKVIDNLDFVSFFCLFAVVISIVVETNCNSHEL